jgi:ABC-type transport system involved in multi-copper enzyme maturation permease subunit
MLQQRLKLELKRIVGIKLNLAFFTFFITLGIFSVYSGIYSYNRFQEEKSLFILQEQNRTDLFDSQDTSGVDSLNILYEPPPLSVFFPGSGVFDQLYSSVDRTGIIGLNSPYKGRNLLLKQGGVKFPAGLFFLFGTLFMAYMGLSSYASEKHYFFYSNVIFRLIYIDIFFLVLMAGLYQVPRLSGIDFFPVEQKSFLYFSLYLLLILNFFYAAGVFFRVLSAKWKAAYMYTFVFWLLSVFLVPGIMATVLEKRAWQLPAGGTKPDEEINRRIEQTIARHEGITAWYPTAFYNYVSGEMSGKGFKGYMELVKYTSKLGDRFIKYLVERRSSAGNTTAAPFIKENETIFKGPAQLPGNFPVGSSITIIYIALFLLLSYIILARRRKRDSTAQKPPYKFRKGNMYFLLCEDDACKRQVFRSYEAGSDTACIDDVRGREIDPGVGLLPMISYFCAVSGVEINKVLEILQQLGVKTEGKKTRRLYKNKLSAGTVERIYCAVAMAGDRDILVINDFLKGKSRQFEQQFLQVVSRLNQSGKIVIYLSSELFRTALPFEGSIKVESHKGFKIDPLAVSLR